MKKEYFFYSSAILFIVTALSYNAFGLDGGIGILANNILYHLAPLFAVIWGFYIVKLYGTDSIHGKAFGFVSCGILAWFIADLLYAVLGEGFGMDVFPSFIDLIYYLGYFFLFAGLFLEARFLKINWTNKRIAYALLSSFMLASFSIFATMNIMYDQENTFYENLFQVFYGIGDLILGVELVIIMVIAFEFWGGKFSKPWLSIFIGNLIIFFGDIVYGVFFEEYDMGLKLAKNIDLFYMAGYLLYAYGFIYMWEILKAVQKKATLQ